MLVSFHVKPFLPSITMKKVLCQLKKFCWKRKKIRPMEKEIPMNTQQNYFSFREIFLNETLGSPKGNLLSTLLSEVSMKKTKRKSVKKRTNLIFLSAMFRRYPCSYQQVIPPGRISGPFRPNTEVR